MMAPKTKFDCHSRGLRRESKATHMEGKMDRAAWLRERQREAEEREDAGSDEDRTGKADSEDHRSRPRSRLGGHHLGKKTKNQ